MWYRNKYVRTILRQIVIWTIALSIFSFIREFGHEINRPLEVEFSLIQRIWFQLLIGVVSGFIFGSYEYFFNQTVTRKMPLGKVIAFGSLGYVLLILVFTLVVFGVIEIVMGLDIDAETFRNFFVSGAIWVVIFYCLLVGFIIEFVKQVDKKFGPGNLVKMMLGRFYEPKAEERIFMFLDMKSSTTIAERLGHIKYSQLVQDCFRDINVVLPFRAEIYQYVGDEVVLTWEKQRGLVNANCIMAYFAFADKLKEKEEHYNSKYGLVPEFKAGINLGNITIAEVGEVKREIAYHGDTINTAARLQNECNRLSAELLVSENLLKQLQVEPLIKAVLKGQVQLRGKHESINIYSIEKSNGI